MTAMTLTPLPEPTPISKPRKAAKPSPEKLQDGASDSTAETAPRRGRGSPKFSDEEAAEIADYARAYGKNAAAKQFGTSWATVTACMGRCPAL